MWQRCSAGDVWREQWKAAPPGQLCSLPSLHAAVAVQDPAAARQLLRSGVFAGLRDNVRCGRRRPWAHSLVLAEFGGVLPPCLNKVKPLEGATVPAGFDPSPMDQYLSQVCGRVCFAAQQ